MVPFEKLQYKIIHNTVNNYIVKTHTHNYQGQASIIKTKKMLEEN